MRPLDDSALGLLRKLAEDSARDNFLELFDLAVRPQGKRLLVSVTLDKKAGAVSLDECTAVSRDLEKRLDDLDPIGMPYLLEVASPGLDRPLRGTEDYRRFKGNLAQAVLTEPWEGRSTVRGRLGDVTEGTVEFLEEGGERLRVPLGNVKRANLVIEDKL